MTNKPPFIARLFYSYCHKDKQHKEEMEKSLSLLRQHDLLREWSDRLILPGQPISSEVQEEMSRADILVFLLSPNFIASNECIKEWNYAKTTLSKKRIIFRIPIIVDHCAWKDLLESDDIKALPRDGQPVTSFSNSAIAWHQVYEGLKLVIDKVRNNFTAKEAFLNKINETVFFLKRTSD